ncbi:MAG TPA: glycosyltransferase [Hanamia sp.]|nr:glycosyltransferase [Hanamia sp.]
MAKTIIHFIFNLGRGGAESMLVQVLKELNEYNNIVVTLQSDNSFENELVCDKYICLNQERLRSIPVAALKFRKIIKKYNPDLVHSHLPLCNFVARLATPSGTPLITTIHTSIATIVDYQKWYFRILDKLTNQFKKSTLIFVSKRAMKDYFSVLKIPPYEGFILYTFVDISRYNQKPSFQPGDVFRILSVGSLRSPKNYNFLIEAFRELKSDKIELTIFGKGPLQEKLQASINQLNVKIILKGEVKNIPEVLNQFDLFVMSSIYEGFSLSVLEAMATQLPLILIDIYSFREQCENCAIYFDLNNTNDFIQKLKYCKDNKEDLWEKAKQGHQRVINHFTLEHHMTGLRKIYLKTLNNII